MFISDCPFVDFACLTFAYAGQYADLTIRLNRGPPHVWKKVLGGPAPPGSSGAFKHGLTWLYGQAELNLAPTGSNIFNVSGCYPKYYCTV